MIEIIQNGPATSLQDSGRAGQRHLGIPESGAADRLSFALANHIVGNPWQAPALECTLGGLQIKFTRNATFALSGADMKAKLGDRTAQPNTAHQAKTGDVLTLGFADTGCRAYLAIAGGLSGSSFAGSVATYTQAAIGGIEGRHVKAGDRLESAGLDTSGPQSLPPGYAPKLSRHVILRARPGPEFEYLTPASKRELFTCGFTASAQTDRMGSRLDGQSISLDSPYSMTSSPLLPGTVQIPAGGQPILAMIDGHCTGGYARALQVIRADLWQMGQITPGSKVSFRRCFESELAAITQARHSFYGNLMDGFTF